MPSRRLILALSVAIGPVIAGAGAARACAVPTRLRVENRSTRRLRQVFVASPGQGPNQLPREGLAPGGTATITLPSCIGLYTVSAIFMDGQRVDHPAIDARTARGLVVR